VVIYIILYFNFIQKKAVDLGSLTQEQLSINLQIFNGVELRFLVDTYLATREALEPPELTQHTRTQVAGMVARNNCPPASSKEVIKYC